MSVNAVRKRHGVRRLIETFHELRRYKQAFLLLVAFLIYNDGIQTIIRMATTFGSQIGIDQNAMITALLITQFIGVPCQQQAPITASVRSSHSGQS